MLIDFTEIPQANKSGGNQDAFELFSRDFIELLGFEIVNNPARGADGGIDFKVKEVRKTVEGEISFYWLASCKHYAHSGTSISPSIEQNILDRTISNGCQGFMGIYSTLPSNGLAAMLKGLTDKGNIEHIIFDRGQIEKNIVGISKLENLFIRYFPESYIKWKKLYYFMEPINLFQIYFETKVKDSIKDVFLISFKSIGNLIKSVRKHDSFENALKEHGITLIHDSEFFHYQHRRDSKYILEKKSITLSNSKDKKYKFLFKHYHNTRTKYLVKAFLTGLILPKLVLKRKGGLFEYDHEKEVADKAKYRYNVIITPNSFRTFELSYTLNSTLYVFNSLIIADDGHFELLNSLFADFKTALL